MTEFRCFIKYNSFQFEIILSQELPEEEVMSKKAKYTTFGDLSAKIVEIFKVALLQELNLDDHVFELTDPTVTNSSIITSSDEKIHHLSVIAVRERPVAFSRGRLSINDPDISYIKLKTDEIISYYLMVGTMAVHYRDWNFNRKSDVRWKSVSKRVSRLYPNIFKQFDGEKCQQLFNRMSMFYLTRFQQLNLKLEPKVQKQFDMLKILHTLKPENLFSNYAASRVKSIAANNEICQFIHIMDNCSFDMYLNTERAFKQSITCKEFSDKYIDKDPPSLNLKTSSVAIRFRRVPLSQ